MSKKTDRAPSDRRDFLKLATLGTLASATAAVAGTASAEETGETGSKDAGYRETEHVKKVYELSRF